MSTIDFCHVLIFRFFNKKWLLMDHVSEWIVWRQIISYTPRTFCQTQNFCFARNQVLSPPNKSGQRHALFSIWKFRMCRKLLGDGCWVRPNITDFQESDERFGCSGEVCRRVDGRGRSNLDGTETQSGLLWVMTCENQLGFFSSKDSRTTLRIIIRSSWSHRDYKTWLLLGRFFNFLSLLELERRMRRRRKRSQWRLKWILLLTVVVPGSSEKRQDHGRQQLALDRNARSSQSEISSSFWQIL